MDAKHYDISGKIGPLYPLSRETQSEWPMYSYDRPAYTFWNGVARGLKARGWSEAEIRDWLQSTHARHTLDGAMGDEIEELGRKWANSLSKLNTNTVRVRKPHPQESL